MTLLRSRLDLVVALLLLLLPTASSSADAPLVLEATIPLPDVQGRIDHMSVDLARGRLLIAELGNDSTKAVSVSMIGQYSRWLSSSCEMRSSV